MLPGRLVAQLAAASRQARPNHLLRAAYALDLLGRTEPGLPFFRPVS
ncbi:hypothetical protein J2T08_001798 [Neorhizobium galegae]|nr:hypothetical protein [Neorhizobium galegae]